MCWHTSATVAILEIACNGIGGGSVALLASYSARRSSMDIRSEI